MESHGQLRARKELRAIADDAILSDHITDQLWPGMLVVDVPDVGKGVVCTNVFQRGICCAITTASFSRETMRQRT